MGLCSVIITTVSSLGSVPTETREYKFEDCWVFTFLRALTSQQFGGWVAGAGGFVAGGLSPFGSGGAIGTGGGTGTGTDSQTTTDDGEDDDEDASPAHCVANYPGIEVAVGMVAGGALLVGGESALDIIEEGQALINRGGFQRARRNTAFRPHRQAAEMGSMGRKLTSLGRVMKQGGL
jgi:hypothetical protein